MPIECGLHLKANDHQSSADSITSVRKREIRWVVDDGVAFLEFKPNGTGEFVYFGHIVFEDEKNDDGEVQWSTKEKGMMIVRPPVEIIAYRPTLQSAKLFLLRVLDEELAAVDFRASFVSEIPGDEIPGS